MELPTVGPSALADPFAATRVEAREAFRRLLDATVADDFAGWDPFDALTSGAVRKVARGRRARQVAIQLNKRSPVNLRPVLGVRKTVHPKTLALFASAAARAPEPEMHDLARALADRLIAAAQVHPDGLAWTYGFDVQTRWGFYAADTPNAVAVAFAANALLDVADRYPDDRYAAAARSALEFACSRFWRGADFGYYEGATTTVYNASMLIAGAIRRCTDIGTNLDDRARAAVKTTLAAQSPDGSWPYGAERGLEWIDGFHTAYVLDALRLFADEPVARGAFGRGLQFYRSRLIDPDGGARATDVSRHPLETHAAATAVTTLVRAARLEPNALDDATRVVRFALEHLRRRDGRFAFKRTRRLTISVPYMRWSDAHMALALSTYAGGADG
jgi:hypothetical protein